MKLYRVLLTCETVVLARNHSEAGLVAMTMLPDDLGHRHASSREVMSPEDLPDKWTPNCVPFGGDEETTIAGILKKR